MRAIIFSGGSYGNLDFYKKELRADDFIITADGGYLMAEKLGVKVDIALGDFDTIDKACVKAEKIVVLNKEKDLTDSQSALLLVKEQKIDKCMMFGGTGSRIDHTLANIFLLKSAKDMGIELCIYDENNIIYYTEDEIEISKKEGYHLSVVQLTDCENVSLSGLYYPLQNKNLPFCDIIGISNEFTEDSCRISLSHGSLLVMLTKDKK